MNVLKTILKIPFDIIALTILLFLLSLVVLGASVCLVFFGALYIVLLYAMSVLTKIREGR